MAGFTKVRILTAALAAVLLNAGPAAAQQTDIIRGRVVGPDTVPLPGVIITAWSLPDSVVKKAGTDDKGVYSITYINGSGRYVVSVAVGGFAPTRVQVTRKPGDSVVVADFKLAHQAMALSGVRSVATRPRPSGGDFASDGTGPGSVSTFMSAYGGLSGDPSGDLASLMAMLPGVSAIPDPSGGLPAISVFGLPGDQNQYTLNGLNFGGATPPRDGFQASLVTSTYDPTVGGFAGGRVSLRLGGGSNYVNRSLHFTLEDPLLEWNTPIASQLGQRTRRPILSGTLSGPIVWDHLFYSSSWQIQRASSPLTTLINEDAASLQALGLSPDSAARIISLLGPQGIPTRVGGIPSQKLSTSGSLYNRIDFRPHLPPPGVQTWQDDQYFMTVGGSWNQTDAQGIGATSVPAIGGQTTHQDLSIEATASKFLPGSVLNELTLGFGTSANRTVPYLAFPTALVRVSSPLESGGTTSTTVQAGGSSSPQSDSRTSSAELRNVTSWYTWDRVHQFKASLDATVDHFAATQGVSNGAFVYNSLADFASGTPASFSRTLTGRSSSGQGLNYSFGIGDIYAPFVNQMQGRTPGEMGHAQLQIQYGVRLEGSHLASRPSYNATVDSLFGLRTDHVPSTFAVIPMVGFSQQYGRFEIAPGQKTWRGTITGGIREYRGTLSAAGLDAYARQTGLPSGVQQLSCIGGAVPVPNWGSYTQSGGIPTQCADGSAASPLSQTTPPVLVYAPDYALTTRWSANLGGNARVNNRIYTTINGTYSRNLHAPGAYDLNFNPTQRFSLASEAGRPVFVSPASIAISTGAVASTESRLFPEFAHVSETRSDLEQESRQISATVGLSPGLIFFGGPGSSFWNASLGYTFSDNRERVRGFSSTAGDPRDTYWSPSQSTNRHAVSLSGSYSVNGLFNVRASGILRSGLPYTPRVTGDINGDGYANDRPFIFNPVTAPDSAVAAGMTNLLASAPRAARDCLQRQLGTIAARNSCEGPWSATLNVSLGFDSYRLGLGNRGTLSFTIVNTLGALDQLLHGPDNVHGWGSSPFADQTLLTVRGFDPVTNRFKYDVNPKFGSASVSQNAYRQPFKLVVDFRMDVGPDGETFNIQNILRPRPVDSTRVLNEKQIKMKLSQNLSTVGDRLIALKDSLKLTQPQIDSMYAITRRYLTLRDSVYTDLAKYLDQLHGNYGGPVVREHWHQTIGVVLRALYASYGPLYAVLTPEQVPRLPFGYSQQLTQLTDPAYLEDRLKYPAFPP